MKATVTALLAGLVSAGSAGAEVTGVAPHGFGSAHVVQVAAPPERVWNALLQPARWWDPSHTYSGEAARLRLEPRAGGCFCETLANGKVRHLTVSDVRRPERLVLTGGLGPLGPVGVAGSMLVTVKPAGGSRRTGRPAEAAGRDRPAGRAQAIAERWARPRSGRGRAMA